MGIFKNLINKVLDAEVPPVVERLVKKGQAQKPALDEENLKRNMYDWVTCGDKEVRSSHAAMNWLRCRWDDPTVCSYDNGMTWKPRPKGATLKHPGDEEGCRCRAHPYLIEHEIELKIKR
jgi:uncharacterized protein with gpF-like domain